MNRTITIISTKTWEKKTLFDEKNVLQVNNPEINKIFDDFFGILNWATILQDNELTYLWENYINHAPNNIIQKDDLKNEQEARNDALQQQGVREYIEKNTKYKEAKSRRTLFRVMNTNVYGIRWLEQSSDATKWIPTLLQVAKKISGDAETLNVNLILHDKDVNDEKYHQDVMMVNNPEAELLPQNESLNGYQINKCNVIFFKHSNNHPIIELIKNPDINNIHNQIDEAINRILKLSTMITDCETLEKRGSE